MFRHIGSRGFPFDEAGRPRPGQTRLRPRPARGRREPAARWRAIVKSGDRTAELARITAPTLVIHGDHDPMVHPSGGRATAAAIPNARLVTIEGMGHDLPAGAVPTCGRPHCRSRRAVRPRRRARHGLSSAARRPLAARILEEVYGRHGDKSARGDHRRRPRRFLRDRPAARRRLRGRPDRPAPDAVRPRPLGRRPRPPEDQIGHARLRQDGRREPGFRFFGGVSLGDHITRVELLEHYHAVVYAFGTVDDNRLGIPGEDRPGSYPATRFVAWYNGHPDGEEEEFVLSRPAGGRDRQRQRRRRRRPDADARARGARGHGHRRPRPPEAGRGEDRGGRAARPAGPRTGRLHQPRAPRARRAEPGRHQRGSRRGRARPAQRAAGSRSTATVPPSATWRCCASTRSAHRRARPTG